MEALLLVVMTVFQLLRGGEYVSGKEFHANARDYHSEESYDHAQDRPQVKYSSLGQMVSATLIWQ